MFKRGVIITLLLLELVACSTAEHKNKVNPNIKRQMTSSEIAMNKYLEYTRGGMNHEEALLMLRLYDGPRNIRNSKDLKIEAEQVMTYYCIEHESEIDLKTCKQRAKELEKKCVIYNFGYYTRPVVTCIKSTLPKVKSWN